MMTDACSSSDTTRNPRPGEENGKGSARACSLCTSIAARTWVSSLCSVSDYHYVTRDVMKAGIDKGEFIENAEFSGNMYGTSKAAVQDVQAKNLICILDIDMQGVKNIKKTDLNPIYISIQPPSMEVLVSMSMSVNTPA